MSKYPKVSDDEFYKKISKIFSKYKIKNEKLTMKEFCYPTKFKLQIPQQFVSEFINPDTPYKGLLIYHQIGAGKTCAAVSIAEEWKEKRNILVVTPASLMGNFYDELRSQCTGDEYVTPKDRKILNEANPSSDKYLQIIKKVNKKIDKFYSVLSYNKFVDKLKRKKINFDKTLLIIDEVQNIVSERGSFYKIISNAIDKAPKDLRIILLSGTPIFDKPVEIGLTMNLLKLPKKIPIGNEFNDMFLSTSKNKDNEITYNSENLDIFKDLIKGYVSFYRGAPPVAFPKTEINIVRCKMSDYQFKMYQTVATNEGPFRTGDILKLPNSFFIGSRIISNIAFPMKGINESGYEKFVGNKLQIANIKKFSTKFYKMIRKIKKCEGTVFVYSNFKEYGGLKSFVKVLEYHGFGNYKDYGEGDKRYAIWSGDEKHSMKEELKRIFNQKENKKGDRLKVILGSPSIKEGVSLLRVNEVHVMEPYWNLSRLDQVIGRAVRFCSHKDVAASQRKVKIFIYIAVHPKDNMTIDKYILSMAESKSEIISKFETALKESAVDCKLFYHGNVHKKREHINCDI